MDIHGKRIRIYRNGETYDHGYPLLVAPTNQRHFEQFLRDASRLTATRVKYAYTTDGMRIRALEDLQDGMGVVVTAGESFRKVDYQLPTTRKRFNAFSKSNLVLPILKDHPIRERKGEKGVELLEHVDFKRKSSEIALFDASTKAFKIAIFENGEFRQPGQKLILNHRNCKSFDQLLKYLSTMKIIKSGQVRKLYDGRTFKRIKHLSQIYDGINLILSSSEPLSQGPYLLIDLLHQPRVMKDYEVIDKSIKICKFFVNGDPYHTGLTLSLTSRRYPDLKRLLTVLNTKIELVSGRIMKLYHTSGTRITDINQLATGEKYVMVSNDDNFIKCRYDMMRLLSTALKPLNGQTLNNKVELVRRRIDGEQLKNENEKINERREERLGQRESVTRLGEIERAGRKIVRDGQFHDRNGSSSKPHSPERSIPKHQDEKHGNTVFVTEKSKPNSPTLAVINEKSKPTSPVQLSSLKQPTSLIPAPVKHQIPEAKPTSPTPEHPEKSKSGNLFSALTEKYKSSNVIKPTSPQERVPESRSYTPAEPVVKTAPVKDFDGTKSKSNIIDSGSGYGSGTKSKTNINESGSSTKSKPNITESVSNTKSKPNITESESNLKSDSHSKNNIIQSRYSTSSNPKSSTNVKSVGNVSVKSNSNKSLPRTSTSQKDEVDEESQEDVDEESEEEIDEELDESKVHERQKSEEYYPKPSTPKQFLSQTKSSKSISKIPISRNGSMTRV